MAIYFVTYDLNNPGQNYPKLIAAIKAYGPHCHCLESGWLIKTTQTAVQIRDHLRTKIDSNDDILVIKFNGYAVYWDKSTIRWIERNS